MRFIPWLHSFSVSKILFTFFPSNVLTDIYFYNGIIYVINIEIGSIIYVIDTEIGSIIYVIDTEIGSTIYVIDTEIGSIIYVIDTEIGSSPFLFNELFCTEAMFFWDIWRVWMLVTCLPELLLMKHIASVSGGMILDQIIRFILKSFWFVFPTI